VLVFNPENGVKFLVVFSFGIVVHWGLQGSEQADMESRLGAAMIGPFKPE
jgi:uncharacterized Rmd1/YagE family protein